MSCCRSEQDHEDDWEGVHLAGNGGAGMYESAVVALMRQVHCSVDDFAVAMLNTIADMASTWGLPAEDRCDANAGPHHGRSGRASCMTKA